MFSTMVSIVILAGNTLLLGGIPVETVSPQCRCQNNADETSQIYNSRNDCDLIPTRETVDKCKTQAEKKRVILLNVTFLASDCERQILNARDNCSDTLKRVMFPYHWTWVHKGEDGMFTIMTYPYDYIIHSLWTLKKANSVIDSVLIIPNNCSIRIGSTSLLRMVFQSLNNMTEPLIKPDRKGYLCYNIDMSYNLSHESLIWLHFLGFVRGIAVKYCCQLGKEAKENQSLDIDTGGEEYKFCSGDIVPTTILMNLTTLLGAVMLIFFPLIVFYFLKEDNLIDVILPETTYSWVNTDDGVFSVQHFMRYLFWWDHPSLLASRIRRILCVLFSPSILYWHIIIEYVYMPGIQNEYMDRSIPLGVKSVPFGFEQNLKNTYYFLGGTYIWYVFSITVSLGLICRPHNIGNAIMRRLQVQDNSYSTFLILDARTLKEYSSIDISSLENYRLAYETLKANLLMVANYKFWVSIIHQWKIRVTDLWTDFDHNCVLGLLFHVIFNIIFTIIYAFFFLVEVIACIFYYGCPPIFTFISVNISITGVLASYFIGAMPRRFNHVHFKVFKCVLILCLLTLLYLTLLYVFIAMVYVYMCSFFILNTTLMFTLVGVIITPAYISYLAYVFSAIYYMYVIYKSFTDKYNAILTLIAKTPGRYSLKIRNVQFVRRDVIYDVVEHILPLRFEIFILSSKYFVLFLYLIMSYNIVEQYELNMQHTEKILSCVLITQVPKVAITLLSHLVRKSPHKEFNEHNYVKQILRGYNKRHSDCINENELNFDLP